MRIAFELPDYPTFADLNCSDLQQALAALLYHQGRISAYEACEWLEIDRRSFEEVLHEFGFPLMSDSADQIDLELRG